MKLHLIPTTLRAKAKEIHQQHRTTPLALINEILSAGAEIAVESFTVTCKAIIKDHPKPK